jgi:hypothetical protein
LWKEFPLSSLNRSAAPQESGPEVWVKRLRANEACLVVVLSDKADGFLSHWTGKYSTLCTQPTSECEGHQRGDPQRWRAYIHCLDLGTGKEFFLEMTKGAFEQMQIQLDSAQTWRGMRLNVKRMSGDASRLKVEILAPWANVSSKPLPVAKDPEQSLRNLYRKNTARETRKPAN